MSDLVSPNEPDSLSQRKSGNIEIFDDEEYILAKATLMEVMQVGADRVRLDAAKYVIERKYPNRTDSQYGIIHVDSINVLLAQAREKISAATTSNQLVDVTEQ